jgi:hypothetical protein
MSHCDPPSEIVTKMMIELVTEFLTELATKVMILGWAK